MYRIEVPKSVRFPGRPESEPAFTLYLWIRNALDQFPEIAKGFENIRKGIRLHDLIAAAEGGNDPVFYVEDADFALIKRALDTGTWNPALVRHLAPFLDAIENAQHEAAAPKESAPKPKEKAKA